VTVALLDELRKVASPLQVAVTARTVMDRGLS
jgi:hypothetical protein